MMAWCSQMLRDRAWPVAAVAVLAELISRAGFALLPWWRGAPRHPLARWGVAFLLGFAAWGLADLGCALAGLYHPVVLAGAAVAMALAAPPRTWPQGRLVTAARAWSGVGPGAAVLLALALLLAGAPALVPETNFDSLVYHLGVPWQYLQVHRAVLGDLQLPFQFSLPVEVAYGLPLALGDDRLARGLMVAAFVAGNAVFAGGMLARGRREAAWTGPVLVLAAPAIGLLVPMAKNDIAASAWFVAGALLTAEGGWGLGAVLLGCALAAKFAYAPLVVLWCLAARPPAGRLGRVAAGLVLPGVPWWIKTWLATGTPVFPFTHAVLASPFWGPMNQAAWNQYVQADWLPDTLRASAVPAAWAGQMREQFLLALLLLPGVAWFSRRRWLTAGVVVAMLATLATGHLARFLVPLVWWLGLAGAGALERLARIAGRSAGSLLAAIVLLGLAADPAGLRPPWRALAGLTAPGDVSTLEEARRKVAGLHPGRLLTVGELRSYPFAGRILFDGAIGETPLVWRMAHAARSVEDLRRMFRQAGAGWMLYNFVSVDWVAARYTAFPWRDDALHRYAEFCRRYLTPVWNTSTVDYGNGGCYLFEVRAHAIARPPATGWFAPGTESIYGRGIALQTAGRIPEALAEYQAAWRRLPEVGSSWNRVGHAFAALADMPQTYHYLAGFAEQGMMDSMNLPEYASALVNTGRTATTERVLEDAWAKYPSQRGMIRINQAGYFGQQALAGVNARRPDAAAAWLDRADRAMADLPAGGDPAREAGRVRTAAYLLGLRGEVALARGDRARAAQCFRDSLQLSRNTPLSVRWNDLSGQLGRQLF